MVTRKLLTADANLRLRNGDIENAQRGLIALIRSAPHDLNARLRAADGLLAMGANAQAMAAYIFVAREGALAGHPLKSIVACKILSRIDPSAQQFLDALAQRYGAGSNLLGRGIRLAPPDPNTEVPIEAFIPAELTAEQVYELAGTVASSREALPGYPATVHPITLLSDLPADAFAKVMAAIELRRVPANEVIVREGEPGDAFFMIARGGVRVSRRENATPGAVNDIKEHTLATLGEGAIFGEMALVSGSPRAATVTATEDSDVLVFGKVALQALAKDIEVVAQALDRFTRERMLSNLLATHPLFRPFDRTQRQQLAARFTVHSVAAGTDLIREGDAGRGIFLILTGECDVSKRDQDAQVLLAVLRPGDVFGEIALIEKTTATATVTAARAVTVLFLSREYFEKLIDAVPELKTYFHQLAEERQMDTNITLSSAREEAEEILSEDDIVLI